MLVHTNFVCLFYINDWVARRNHVQITTVILSVFALILGKGLLVSNCSGLSDGHSWTALALNPTNGKLNQL